MGCGVGGHHHDDHVHDPGGDHALCHLRISGIKGPISQIITSEYQVLKRQSIPITMMTMCMTLVGTMLSVTSEYQVLKGKSPK